MKNQPNQRATGFNQGVNVKGSGQFTQSQPNKNATGLNSHVADVPGSGTATKAQPNKNAAGLNMGRNVKGSC
jgi:hypothetical protein